MRAHFVPPAVRLLQFSGKRQFQQSPKNPFVVHSFVVVCVFSRDGTKWKKIAPYLDISNICFLPAK
jgi:hypothetical protein